MAKLYYSKYCPTCLNLFMKMKEMDMFGCFDDIVCVDDPKSKGTRRDIPLTVTCVPFILDNEHKSPIINGDVFEWLKYKDLKKKEAKQVETPFAMFSANSNDDYPNIVDEMEKMKQRRQQEDAANK